MSGLTPEQATASHDGGSSVAWTLGHVTHLGDSWINVNFQGGMPHPVIGRAVYRTGGSGEEKDWSTVVMAVEIVRVAARRFLDAMPAPDLDRGIPYDGSIEFLHPVGLRLSYAVMRIAAHHFVHAGEVVTIASRLGHTVDEGPEWGKALA